MHALNIASRDIRLLRHLRFFRLSGENATIRNEARFKTNLYKLHRSDEVISWTPYSRAGALSRWNVELRIRIDRIRYSNQKNSTGFSISVDFEQEHLQKFSVHFSIPILEFPYGSVQSLPMLEYVRVPDDFYFIFSTFSEYRAPRQATSMEDSSWIRA